jgi:hypothetical protein
MKKAAFGLLALISLVLFTGASIWEGAAAVSTGGEVPESGLYVATNSFPKNTVVDVTNLETGKTVRAIVAAGLESPGLLALLSRDSATEIGLEGRSIGRIRMTQPADPIAFSKFGDENFRSGDPDFDPEAALRAYGREIPPNSDETEIEAETKTKTEPEPQKETETQKEIAETSKGAAIAETKPEIETPEPVLVIAPATTETPPEPAAEVADHPPEKAEVSDQGRGEPHPLDSSSPGIIGPVAVPDIAETKINEPRRPATIIEDPRPVEIAGVVPIPQEKVSEAPKTEKEPEIVAVAKDAKEPEKEVISEKQEFAEIGFAETKKEESVVLSDVPEIAETGKLIDLPDEEAAWFVPSVPETNTAVTETAVAETANEVNKDIALVPADERPPEAEPLPDGTHFIDPISVIPPAENEKTEIPNTIPGVFSIPTVGELEPGKYYLQLGAYSKTEAVESEIKKIEKSYPLAVQCTGTTDKPVYRILLGPVNHGESGALLQRFKGDGYKDAFIRSGSSK